MKNHLKILFKFMENILKVSIRVNKLLMELPLRRKVCPFCVLVYVRLMCTNTPPPQRPPGPLTYKTPPPIFNWGLIQPKEWKWHVFILSPWKVVCIVGRKVKVDRWRHERDWKFPASSVHENCVRVYCTARRENNMPGLWYWERWL